MTWLRRDRGPNLLLFVPVILVLVYQPPAFATHGETTLVSIWGEGKQASLDSSGADLSADGRYVTFASWSSEFVPDDTNGWPDIFVRDRSLGTTERVSVSSSGKEADGPSGYPSISGDGRYIAFMSHAQNLLDEQGGGATSAYVKDRVTGAMHLASPTLTGENGDGLYPAISADGRFVAFLSRDRTLVEDKSDTLFDYFVRDMHAQDTTWIRCGRIGPDVPGWRPSISDDGRYVAFGCQTTLGPNQSDVVLHDTVTTDRSIVSVTPAGLVGAGSSFVPSISGDGRYVAFLSLAPDLVDQDTNGVTDVFVRDLVRRKTEIVSLSSSGEQAQYPPGIGPGQGQVSTLLSPASIWPSISADGRYITFESTAWNLVDDDTNLTRDTFVRDRAGGTTRRVSIASDGQQALDASYRPAISADGQLIAFHSWAPNLVAEDTNGVADVFVHDLLPGSTCPSGTHEDGPLSAPIHYRLEPHAGPAGSPLHEANCSVLADNGF